MLNMSSGTALRILSLDFYLLCKRGALGSGRTIPNLNLLPKLPKRVEISLKGYLDYLVLSLARACHQVILHGKMGLH